MKRFGGAFTIAFLLAFSLICGRGHAIVLTMPSDAEGLVSPGETWRFFRGTGPAGTPAEAWRQVDFDDSAWETGPAGFGYGDGDDATLLDDMQGRYLTVYIRKDFAVEAFNETAGVELTIDYDDGFIAYLNGREVARRSMPAGEAARHVS